MKRTRVCDLLGIEYPILQGGMNVISNAEMAAAVSNAGGLGIVTAFAGAGVSRDPAALVENLRAQVRKTKSLTDKPFGVNYPVLGTPKELIDVSIEEKVPVVTTSAGSPTTYTKYLKDAGVKVLHVVASVRHARKAEEEGVDGIIAEGIEAGGHDGRDEIPTFVLIPQVVDVVKVPVIAAGGIVDSRGLVAAFALGAEGIQMGTVFITTHECMAHPNFKEAIIKAGDTDTVITGRKLGPTRCLKNPLTDKLVEMEAAGASADELQEFIGFDRITRGAVEGDLSDGEAYCGAGAGMIKDIVSCEEVIKRVLNGYEAVLKKLP